MDTKLLFFIILGTANFYLGLSSAIKNRTLGSVIHAGVFGLCLYEVLEGVM